MPHEPGHTFDQAAEQYTSAYTLANMIKDIEGIKEAYKDSWSIYGKTKGASFLKDLFTGNIKATATRKGITSAEKIALEALKTKITEKYAKQLRDTHELSEERSMKDAEETWKRALDIVDAKPITPSMGGDVAGKRSLEAGGTEFKTALSGWARNPEYDPTLPEKAGVKEFIFTGTGDYTEDGTYMPYPMTGPMTGSRDVYSLPTLEGMTGTQGYEGMPTHVARGDEYVDDPLSAYKQKDLDSLIKPATIDVSILNKAIEAEKKKGTAEGDAKAAELEEKKKEAIKEGSKPIDPTKPKEETSPGTPEGTPEGTSPGTPPGATTMPTFGNFVLDPALRRTQLGQVSMADYAAGLPSFLPGGDVAPLEATYQDMMGTLQKAYRMAQRLGLVAPDPAADAGATGTYQFEQWLSSDPDYRGILETGLNKIEEIRNHLNRPGVDKRAYIENMIPQEQAIWQEYLAPRYDAEGNIEDPWFGAKNEHMLRQELIKYMPETLRYAASQALSRKYRQGMVADPLNQYNIFQGMPRPSAFGESAYPINPNQPADTAVGAVNKELTEQDIMEQEYGLAFGATNLLQDTAKTNATDADIDALNMSYNLGADLEDKSPIINMSGTTGTPVVTSLGASTPISTPISQGPTFVKHPQDPISTPMTTVMHQPGTFNDQAYWNRQRDLGNIHVPQGMMLSNTGQLVPIPGQYYAPGYAAAQVKNPGYDASMHWKRHGYPTGMKLG